MADTEKIKEIEARVKHLVDKTANWNRANPILLSGEIGIEVLNDNSIAIKVGDGQTSWKMLNYVFKTVAEQNAEREALQNQIDNIVIETSEDGGDVSAEVAQARVDAHGNNYATLKDRLDTADTVADDKLGSYGSYITSDPYVPENIADVVDIPPNRIMVFGGKVTAERVSNLPEYGKAVYVTKFYATPYGNNDSLYYLVAVNTLGKMWYSAYSVGKSIKWQRVATGESVDYLGSDTTKVVNQKGIDYWCQKGYGVYLNDETFESLGIHSLLDIPKNTTISSNGEFRGLSESNISGLPVYNKNVTITRISALSERTGEDLSRTVKDASGILDMFIAMWVEKGKPIMKYCFATSATATTEWVGVISDNNRKENSYGITMFEKIGVISDSISCGWGFDKNGNRSRRNLKISWVQQMARRIGCTAYNLGASGVDPVEWFQPNYEFAEYCYTQYQAVGECDLYIVGLGLNQATLGTINDINETDYTQNANTFYGQYARIVQMINAEHPNAIVMCLTEPTTRINSYDVAVRDICNSGKVNALLVDLENDYSDLFNTPDIKAQYQSDNLHLTPYGYSLLADAMIRAINDYISKNADKFRYVGVAEV